MKRLLCSLLSFTIILSFAVANPDASVTSTKAIQGKVRDGSFDQNTRGLGIWPSGGSISTALTEEEALQKNISKESFLSPILNNTILAFYGKPGSKNMGILGLYSPKDLFTILKKYVKQYDDANGTKSVIPAFYLIMGTCWPKGEIGFLKESVIMEYIKFAQENNALVFLDHQIGKYTVEEAMKRLLPYMKYKNVHAAIDPEWRTLKPMEEIGSITADELNKAQSILSEYLKKEGIQDNKMLVVHQFNYKMITNRENVKADYNQVQLIHCSDGFGIPAIKKMSWKMNVQAENMPLKSFKLFLKSDFPLAGYDNPLLSPKEVMELAPEPVLIMYQ